ncbi:hypothetical protein Bca4012_025300 [Brassica carinata]
MDAIYRIICNLLRFVQLLPNYIETMGLDTKSQEKLEAKQERGPSAGQDKGTKNRAPMAPFDDTERGRMKTTKPALTYNRFDSLLSLSDD